MPAPAIFLDKDGTLVEDVPYNVDPERIRLRAGAREGLRLLDQAGYRLIIVSNQSGVARGYFPESALHRVTLRLQELLGIHLSGVYYCPHHPEGTVPVYSITCDCRKPQPGLLLRAAEDHDIDLTRSWLIGDALHDIAAGHAAGCRAILVKDQAEDIGNQTLSPRPDHIASNLHQAAAIILNTPDVRAQLSTQHSALSTSSYVGRLAPSPTGAQHVGNARSYLIAWLAARSVGGKVVLRIEDIDSPRIKAGAAAQALDDLRWLGLDWDEGPIVQTKRLHYYEQALRNLQAAELVYPCTCTRSDIDRAASAPHVEHEGPAYPGTCAQRRAADATDLQLESFAWRFRVAADLRDAAISFVDGLRGPMEVNLHELGGDFVVWKSAGTPAYQLAVVVDDADQGVTEVIRGDDLIPSTPRQILLYQALGLQPPRFTHVPLVVGPDGRRLAKRHGDTRLSTLREAGIQPEALLGLLAWSCGWAATSEPVTARQLIPHYRLDALPREPFILEDRFLRL